MKNSFWIILTLSVIALQVFWMSNVGYALPYVPHFFVLLLVIFPYRYPTKAYLLYAFFTGLIIDIFYGTGGLYALASLTFAGLRQIYLTQFKSDLTGKNLRFEEWNLVQLIFRLLIAIVVFEFLVYFFDFLSINAVIRHLSDILRHSLTTWFFVTLFSILFLYKTTGINQD